MREIVQQKIDAMTTSSNIKLSVFGLVESMSRTLAPTKPEMEVCLETELRLSSDPNSDPVYLNELRQALHILRRSPDVTTFLSELRDRASDVPTSPTRRADPTTISPAVLDEELTTRAELTALVMRKWFAGLIVLIGFMVSGMAGYFHSGWKVPVAAGFVVTLARDAAEGFRLTRTAGLGFLVRSTVMAVILMGIFWGIGYALSRV